MRQRMILGRPSRSEPSSKTNRIWRHDLVVLIDPADSTPVAYYVPRRCPDCHETILYDERENPYCPKCGLIFGEKARDPEVIEQKTRIDRYRLLKSWKRARFARTD